MWKTLHIVLAVLTLLVVAPVCAQVSGHSTEPSTHGLKLVFKQVSDGNLLEQVSYKTCVRTHPPLACMPLTLALRNEGTETVLRWTSTCSSDYWFEIANDDGSWRRFPRQLPLCARNMLYVQRITPGQSYELHFKLSDPTLLLDTQFPIDQGSYRDAWITSTPGSTLLTGQRSPKIRVVYFVDGCVAAQKDIEKGIGQTMDPFDGESLCFGGKKPEQDFIRLESNELELVTAERTVDSRR
jgi:hypothetical protein